jgi:hypothetical protein
MTTAGSSVSSRKANRKPCARGDSSANMSSMSDPKPLVSAARELEDSFFLKENQKLIEKRQALNKLKQTKEALSKVSGIHDDGILQKLIDLEIHPNTVASLAVVPLIEVAWADGEIDDKEREAVLQAANSDGIRRGDIEYELLENWLAHRPEPRLLAAWRHYIEGLCAVLTADERSALKRELLEYAASVARASGGLLGLGNRISKSEAAVLRTLEEAFGN